jgi:hypothetical protein
VELFIDQTGHDGEFTDLIVRSLTVRGERATTYVVIENTRQGWVARCLDETGQELPDYQGWTWHSDHDAAHAGLMYGFERAVSA